MTIALRRPIIAAIARRFITAPLFRVFGGVPIAMPGMHLYVKKTHGPDRYRIMVDFTPQCNGANV